VPRWDPSSEWDGTDAYVIGGGTSLRHFDWDLIAGKNTIGCNSAYILGAHIVKIILFADVLWWDKIGKKGTEGFGGRVVGCVPDHRFEHRQRACPWLLTFPRSEVCALGRKTLGFFGNTGAMAINLALILGARRVFLLGFDMMMGPDRQPNFHNLRYERGNADSYPRFLRLMAPMPGQLKKVFPGREVWNVTNNSRLDLFPKATLEEHFAAKLMKEGT
jgi:hypothetical protein